MTDDDTEDAAQSAAAIAAHQEAADRLNAEMAALLALAHAKGLDTKTIGRLVERERADAWSDTTDPALLAAIRRVNAAYRDVTMLATRMSDDDLAESNARAKAKRWDA